MKKKKKKKNTKKKETAHTQTKRQERNLSFGYGLFGVARTLDLQFLVFWLVENLPLLSIWLRFEDFATTRIRIHRILGWAFVTIPISNKDDSRWIFRTSRAMTVTLCEEDFFGKKWRWIQAQPVVLISSKNRERPAHVMTTPLQEEIFPKVMASGLFSVSFCFHCLSCISKSTVLLQFKKMKFMFFEYYLNNMYRHDKSKYLFLIFAWAQILLNCNNFIPILFKTTTIAWTIRF